MNYEQHIQQNNERLLCLKQALQDQTTFVAAVKELLEWCLDPRAFQKSFEDNIIGCLNVVTHVAGLDGFDLNLSCRLLSVCANYRDKFSPHYAAFIEKWNEKLSQSVLLRHQPATSSVNTSANAAASMDGSKMMQKSATVLGAPQQDVMWQSGPGGAVSVVTTVYSGAVSGYPNGAQQNYSAANTNMYGAPVVGTPGGYATHQNAPQMQKAGPVYTVDGSYANYHHQPYHHVNNSDYGNQAPQAAALNAAQVAAAAVATATATATAVALDQSQYQPYHGQPQNAYGNQQYGAMMPNQYGNPRMMPSNGSIRPQMPPNYNSSSVRSRSMAPANYGQQQPSTAKMMPMMTSTMQMAPVQYNTGGQQAMRGNASMAAYHHQQQQQQQQQQHHMMPTAVSYRQRLPNNVTVRNPQYGIVTQNATYANVPYSAGPLPGQMIAGYPTRVYNPASEQQQVGACPGNPTPPMTPVNAGGLVSPPGYPAVISHQQHMNNMPVDIKPAVNCQDPADDDRLTTLVREGIIMMPFRLEHNSPVTQHMFILDEQRWNFLSSSIDIDLQLKCFHQDDKMMACNWPANANVQICVNGTPVPLFNNEKPLYIKRLCQPNKNMLQISVQQCSCSHLFILSLVQRPKIATVKDNLLRRKLLTQEQAMEKIKRFFHAGEPGSVRSVDGHADIEQMSATMPLRCPISMQRIELPARGQTCRHPQCFDVETFLKINKDKAKWACPLCRNELHLDSLEVDQYVWGIITNLKDTTVEEVSIDAAAMWKPIHRPSQEDNNSDGGGSDKIKEEYSGVSGNPNKRFKAEPGTSVGQTTAPWTPSGSNAYGGPPTPGAVLAAANIASPSYGHTNSPLNAGHIQRQRSSTSTAPLTPLSSVGGACTPGAYPPTPRQAMGPPTPQQVCGSGGSVKVGPLTPVTPLAVYNPPSVGQPKSVEPIQNLSSTQHQTTQNSSQIDTPFASSSAPYTPASVSSTGSQYGNGANAVMPNDMYSQDLYGDIELFLNDSTATDSTGLFADSIDPLELSTYLENGAANANNSSNNINNAMNNVNDMNSATTSSLYSYGGNARSVAQDYASKSSSVANENGPKNFAGAHSVGKTPTSTPASTASVYGESTTSLDDVLSFLN